MKMTDNELQDLFLSKVIDWTLNNQAEGLKLREELILWGKSTSIKTGKFGAVVIEQIKSKAQASNVSAEKIIDKLFSCTTADSFMVEFQLSN